MDLKQKFMGPFVDILYKAYQQGYTNGKMGKAELRPEEFSSLIMQELNKRPEYQKLK